MGRHVPRIGGLAHTQRAVLGAQRSEPRTPHKDDTNVHISRAARLCAVADNISQHNQPTALYRRPLKLALRWWCVSAYSTMNLTNQLNSAAFAMASPTDTGAPARGTGYPRRLLDPNACSAPATRRKNACSPCNSAIARDAAAAAAGALRGAGGRVPAAAAAPPGVASSRRPTTRTLLTNCILASRQQGGRGRSKTRAKVESWTNAKLIRVSHANRTALRSVFQRTCPGVPG